MALNHEDTKKPLYKRLVGEDLRVLRDFVVAGADLEAERR